MYILIIPINNVKNTTNNEPKILDDEDDEDDDDVKKRVELFLSEPFLIAIVENQQNRKKQITQITIT